MVALLQEFPAVLRDHLELALGKLLGAGAAGSARAGSVFQVLLRCQEQPSACCCLLAEGLRAQAPVLSVLAACCPVSGAPARGSGAGRVPRRSALPCCLSPLAAPGVPLLRGDWL